MINTKEKVPAKDAYNRAITKRNLLTKVICDDALINRRKHVDETVCGKQGKSSSQIKIDMTSQKKSIQSADE